MESRRLGKRWLAEAYYNLGLTQDKAGLYDAALKNLDLHLLAALRAADARHVKNLIYEVEYRRDKAAQGNAWLRKIDGRRYAQPACCSRKLRARNWRSWRCGINRRCITPISVIGGGKPSPESPSC
jgi:hypothetical protein